MKKALLVLLLLPLIGASVLAPGSYTVPTGTTITVPTPVTPPPICTPPATLVNGVCTTPVTPPPATGTLWLYYNGVFSGAGDYNYGNAPFSFSYANPTSTALSGTKDCLATGDMAWQPRMPGDDLNTGPYNYITVSIRPTQVETFITGAEMIGDVAIPGSTGSFSIAQYGPNPIVVGAWNTYKIPLTAYGIKTGSGLHIYKVMFQHQAGPGVNLATDKTEFDNFGFTP